MARIVIPEPFFVMQLLSETENYKKKAPKQQVNLLFKRFLNGAGDRT